MLVRTRHATLYFDRNYAYDRRRCMKCFGPIAHFSPEWPYRATLRYMSLRARRRMYRMGSDLKLIPLYDPYYTP